MSAPILKRKLRNISDGQAGHSPGGVRAFEIALARAAQDRMRHAMDVRPIVLATGELQEVLDRLPEQALILLLEGAGGRMGLVAFSQPAFTGMIEAQTTGRILPREAPPRRPTRTDAAIIGEVFDHVLRDMEGGDAASSLPWLQGYRCRGLVEEPRTLPLILEEVPHQILRAEVQLAGIRDGAILMAVPALDDAPPAAVTDEPAAAPKGPHKGEDLSDMALAPCALDAVIDRIVLPIGTILTLVPGTVLPLIKAQIGRLAVQGGNGEVVGYGRLGQLHGMRALRLSEVACLGPTGLPATPLATGPAAPPAPPPGTGPAMSLTG